MKHVLRGLLNRICSYWTRYWNRSYTFLPTQDSKLVKPGWCCMGRGGGHSRRSYRHLSEAGSLGFMAQHKRSWCEEIEN
ncbi:hypothetical protein WJX77_008476 [Trebouxia sp. C0004]